MDRHLLRRAAANFDRYVYGALLDEVISRLRERVELSGDVLEIACGAGQWTQRQPSQHDS